MVSFIVPIYNVEAYLPRTLESIVCQKGDWELILVDDGSPDDCPQICDRYAARYPHRVTVVHKENGGVSTARNAGLDIALGEWIWFVDGDDAIQSDALERLAEYMGSDDSQPDVVQFGHRRFHEDGGRLEPEVLPPHLVGGQDIFLHHPCFNNVTMLFRRDIIEQAHLRFTPGLRLGEDMEFQVKYLTRCRKAVQAPLSPSIYTVRSGSAMQSTDTRRRMVDDLYRVLLNLPGFITATAARPAPWLAMRVRGFMTNLLYSASLSHYDTANLQTMVRNVMRQYDAASLPFFHTAKMQLARVSVKAYILLNKMYLKARGLK